MNKRVYKKKYGCPVCSQHFFRESYEICPVCGWENDPVQRREPNFAGGANKLSLNEAKRVYSHEKNR